MNMLLAFAPFIVFAVLERLSGLLPALAAAAVLSAIFLLRDAISPTRRVKLLEIGTLLLFGGLSVYAFLTGADWSVLGVRLRVDAGLLAVVLVSLAVRRPFTLQYAKEEAPPEVWANPAFLRLNDVLTAVWALAFAVMVLADLLMLYRPEIPLRVGVLVTVAAIVGAIKFTGWYVERAKKAAAARA